MVPLTIALVGNPNCGKTTLFNALTGTWQQVGNWAGVTVECKKGTFTVNQQVLQIIDLPGTYTLTTIEEEGPQDENITSEFLNASEFSLILNVIDGISIERNLYLTLQCLEQNVPVVVALNRMDLARLQGQHIDVHRLQEQLGCPVIPIVARKQQGIEALKAALVKPVMSARKMHYPLVVEDQLQELSQIYHQMSGKTVARYQLIRWLEGEPIRCNPQLAEMVEKAQQQIAQSGQAADVVIAKARYDRIEEMMMVVKHSRASPSLTAWLDKIVCHRYLGIPLFLLIMYVLFFFAINIGGAFQDFFELSSHALFVEGFSVILKPWLPEWLMALLVSGVGQGISTVITFVPVIGAMFLALTFLEDCGYMARAAFVVDRLMQTIGLPGKSFAPMIIGFGCNVPAIMGTRALDNKRDRILAVMMSPFMSCGARLAIFTVFVAAFFPQGGSNIIFLLYLIGIGVALLTALLLKKTLLRGESSPLLLEMPAYQWPHWPSLWLHVKQRLSRFVLNAGKLILPICMIIGTLNHITPQGQWVKGQQTSLLASLGQRIVPLFKPLGIDEENWPAAVGLVTGVVAKEVVIGTLNSLYSSEELPEATFDLSQRLKQAFNTIGENFAELTHAWRNPIAAKAPQLEMTHHAYGEMVERFNNQTNALAYLLFVLLYFPCVSVTAAMIKEVQKGWTLFSICWTTGLAYSVAVIYYQAATFIAHPWSSSLWIGGLCSMGALVFLALHYYSRRYLPKILPTRIVLT